MPTHTAIPMPQCCGFGSDLRLQEGETVCQMWHPGRLSNNGSHCRVAGWGGGKTMGEITTMGGGQGHGTARDVCPPRGLTRRSLEPCFVVHRGPRGSLTADTCQEVGKHTSWLTEVERNVPASASSQKKSMLDGTK